MKMLSKIVASCLLLVVSLTLTQQVSAHVVVRPSEVGVAAFQTFTISVPNEKDTSVVALRILIPDGLKSVSPNVKPDWTIDVKKTGEGEDAKVKEIDWTGGSVPEGQRDDFFFSAQVPSNETTLSWKAYQTYADGTVVSWDQATNPNMSDEDKEKMEGEGKGPLSQTKIVNDLKQSPENKSTEKQNKTTQTANLAILLSLAAVAIAATSLMRSNKK